MNNSQMAYIIIIIIMNNSIQSYCPLWVFLKTLVLVPPPYCQDIMVGTLYQAKIPPLSPYTFQGGGKPSCPHLHLRQSHSTCVSLALRGEDRRRSHSRGRLMDFAGVFSPACDKSIHLLSPPLNIIVFLSIGSFFLSIHTLSPMPT